MVSFEKEVPLKICLAGMFLFSIFFMPLVAQTINPDKPAKGKWNLNQTQLWQTDSAGDHPLSSIQNVLILPDGQLAALDNKEVLIHLFSADGQYIRSFGKRGEGPGEFRTLNRGQQIFSTRDQIIFCDIGRLQRFDLNGTFIGQTDIPATLDPATFLDSGRFISAPGTSDQPNREIPLEIYHCDSGKRRVLIHFKPYEKATASEGDSRRTITVAVVIGNITPLMLAGANQKRIAYGMSDRYEISSIDLDGKPQNSFSLAGRKPRPVSGEFKKRMKNRIGNSAPPEMVSRIIDGLPAYASYFSDIRLLDNDMTLVFVSDPDRQNGATIDIFSSQGVFLYQADFSAPPGHTIENYEFSENHLFMATLDEEGYPYLTCYRIAWPEN